MAKATNIRGAADDPQCRELSGVWGEDETIGWVYQFFNSDEERKKMRDESQAPRNSRELAVRNQFFTPRYVVQFLDDNTLGRLWLEMHGEQTSLTELASTSCAPSDEPTQPARGRIQEIFAFWIPPAAQATSFSTASICCWRSTRRHGRQRDLPKE